MSNFFAQYPANGVLKVATFTSLPVSAADGTLAITLDTDTLYVYSTNTNTWLALGSPSAVLSIGTIDSQPPGANGATLNVDALIMQSASVSFPGLVNNLTQSFSGNKTFTGSISAANLSGTNTGDVTLGTANGLSLAGQILSLGLSSTSTTGALSSTDWNTFNNKQSALSLTNLTDVGTDGITITNGTGAVVGTSPVTLSQHVADSTHNGYLSSADWSTFNSKQPAGSYITALTGDVTATGPGSVAATLATVNANVGSFTLSNITVNAKGLVTAASNTSTGNLTDAGTDGITVTGGTGAVIGSGTSLSQHVSDSTHNGYLSSVDWSTFNSKANEVLPTNNQMVYVSSLSGSDITGTGAYDKPYASVAHAMTTITDASSNKPYVIALQANRQVETTDVFMKPYTFICGQGQRATYMRINGGSLKPDPSHASVNSWVGLFNLYWGGSTAINWDLQALGGSNCEFLIQNCTVTGNFTYKGRNSGGGDFLEAYTGVMFGPIVIDSVSSQLQSLEIIGTTTITDTQAAAHPNTFNNMVFDANVAFTAGGAMALNNCVYVSGVTLTTTGTVTINSFRGLPTKANRSFSGGTTVTNIDDATIVAYTPATSANWNTLPTDVSSALDTLAISGVAKSQSQNIILASPNGSSGLPTFRALVVADLPASILTNALTNTHIFVGNGSNVATDVAVSGDLTLANTGAFTIANNVVSNAKLAQMPTLTIKGNNTGGTANALDLTVAQVNLILPVFTSTLNGLTPLSGGGSTNFLRADGTWAAPSGSFINPMTTLGDIIYENATPAPARLAGNTTATKNFLTQTGTGSVSAAPAWGAIASADLPTITLTGDITGSASGGSIATTLATVNANVGTFASVTVNAKGLVTAAAALSGDATTSGAALTLATVNSNVGSFTNANITVNAKGLITAASNGTAGTVTSVSVVSANGLAGTVATATSTPAITLSTTINSPVLAGNGTAISAATTTGTGSIVVLSAAPAITGAWTLTDAGTIINASTASKVLAFSLSGMTAARTLTLSSSQSTTQTLTIPNITASDTLVTLGLAQTFSAANTFSAAGTALTVTNGATVGTLTLTNALSIANGGTGQTTKTAAFDALSPTTTKGDLIVNNGTNNVRQAVGTNNFVLTADSTQATGVKWAASSSSPVAPTSQTFLSGSGTYTTPASTLYIRVTMVGAGGGGGGTGTAGSGGSGGTGNNTTFGTTLLAANGGTGGNTTNGANGIGGTASLGSGPTGIAVSGGSGQGSQDLNTTAGGIGAASALGGSGGGAAGDSATTGGSGMTNTGGGGGGAAGSATFRGGPGGGSGGYVQATITSPAATYSYSVGTAGSAGTAGTGGTAGGAGGSGMILVEEFYQ